MKPEIILTSRCSSVLPEHPVYLLAKDCILHGEPHLFEAQIF